MKGRFRVETTGNQIPFTVTIDFEGFKSVLTLPQESSREHYQLALEGYSLSLNDSLETLISLPTLKNIKPFWYQEETARKVIRSFKGRALLADEVGLGKTIEACLVLKEYILRGLVANALILTPAPLVSQWKEELQTKFELDFCTTDDPDFETGSKTFWQRPWILASLSTAKTQKNSEWILQREFDIVIVDEAHHLKNHKGLAWRLVNSLKKRFLLLLTATPVENNLIEIYNIVTLLKTGQLKTQASFQREFIDRKDPLKPKNQVSLKESLREVMIRNTRAVANIHLPPRHAETIVLNPSPVEHECYGRLTQLTRQLCQEGNRIEGGQLWLKGLLAQAGSSLAAVAKTLSGMLENGTWPALFKDDAHVLLNLCRQQDVRTKEKVLLQLAQSSPDKKIVFVKYRATLESLSHCLLKAGVPHAIFSGQMTNHEKDAQIAAFAEHLPVLLATESGGEGRNLQFCHIMVNFDLPWNPMKIEQRIGRLHRIGQAHEVQIYNLCAKESLEYYLLDLLDRKINMFEMVLGEVEMILGRLTDEKEFDERIPEIWMQSKNDEEAQTALDLLGDKLLEAKKDYAKTKEWSQTVLEEDFQV